MEHEPSPPRTRLCVQRPERLRRVRFVASPGSTFALNNAKDKIEALLGRPVSTSIVMRRALEIYSTKVNRLATPASKDRELVQLVRHAR